MGCWDARRHEYHNSAEEHAMETWSTGLAWRLDGVEAKNTAQNLSGRLGGGLEAHRRPPHLRSRGGVGRGRHAERRVRVDEPG